MDTLPDDVARVVEELLGPREIGALGCAGKRWRPSEKIWERVAKRDPLTHCTVVPCVWSLWCEALSRMETLDADRVIDSTLSEGDGMEEYMRLVLQIWRGDKLLATKHLEFEPDTCHYGDGTDAWDNVSAICAGTDHLHVGNDVTPCMHCREMAARPGETVSDSLGVRIGLDAESLRFRVVALPCEIPPQNAFAPTIVFSIDVPKEIHGSFVNKCQGLVADILSDSFLREPEDSSEWGLTLHHEDLVFYPLDQAWLMSSPLDEDQVGLTSSPLSSRPSIVVRIVRDAAGAAVDLVIEEFNWEDRSPRFAQIRMNFL
ncbi:unnamed protein product [Pelagomonas calceolata]|uniref:Uncharacterized protein n=1 Tax=Pelagomonas calceolata TaxID=35677 RepID=A0A8J2SZN4_9STRA|nr:unnamed protein product [Pelagomonas calceolata]